MTALEMNNLGLVNIGGAAWQTIAGYSSTSTHGSGLRWGPVADTIKSLVLVTTGAWQGFAGQCSLAFKAATSLADGVYAYRIEASDGITNPKAYSSDYISLLQ